MIPNRSVAPLVWLCDSTFHLSFFSVFTQSMLAKSSTDFGYVFSLIISHKILKTKLMYHYTCCIAFFLSKLLGIKQIWFMLLILEC